jgi:hypothetical protein
MTETEAHQNGGRLRQMFDGRLPLGGDHLLLAMVKGALKLPLTAKWEEVAQAFQDLQARHQR